MLSWHIIQIDFGPRARKEPVDHRGGASLIQSLHTKLIRTVLPLNGQDCPFLRFGAGARTFILGVMFFPMDGSNIGKIAAILILVAFSAYFSATETAFTSLNRIRLKSKADAGDRRAAFLLKMSEDYDSVLSTLLIGNNIVNNAATTLATVLFISLLGEARGPAMATLAITLVILIFGEISPKSLAKESPERFARFSAPFLRGLMVLMKPLTFLNAQWKKLLSRLFCRGGREGITEEELMTMVSEAESEGGLDQHEGKLIRSAIAFGDLEVGDILTPRVDIAAVPEDAGMEEAAAAFAGSGYSRLPVYRDSIDDIVGVIHEKDFYADRWRGQTELKGSVCPILYTTPSTKLAQLLRTFQSEKAHMAVVVDEYGGTEGLVTIEDVVEELVGEIWDEHDEIVEEFRKQEDGSWMVDGGADFSDFCQLFSLGLDCDASTVSGWVTEELERLPQAGDSFRAHGLEVTVARVDHRRVLEIRAAFLDPGGTEA